MRTNAVQAQPHLIVPLDPDWANDAGEVLANAFQNERNFAYILPNPVKRADVLPWFFSAAIKAGQMYGEVHTTPSLDGVAVWLKPGGALGFSQMLRTGLITLPVRFGVPAFMRAMRLNGHLDAEHEEQVGDRRWYLMALGVSPDKQGQGIGRALLEPILRRADADGIPCYLETFNKRSLSFYQRHGFAVSAQGDIPDNGPHYWTMVRRK